MASLFITLGILILLFSVSVGFVVLTRYFFPSVEQFIPDDWKPWLTFRYVSYFVLVGVVLLLIGS